MSDKMVVQNGHLLQVENIRKELTFKVAVVNMFSAVSLGQ